MHTLYRSRGKVRSGSNKSGWAAAKFLTYLVIMVISAWTLYTIWSAAFLHDQSHKERIEDVQEAVRMELGTSLKLVQFFGEDGTDNNNDNLLEYMYVVMKPTPDSYPVKYQNVTIFFKDMFEIDMLINYSANINCSIKNSSDNRSIYNDSNFGSFGFRMVKFPFDTQEYNPNAFIPGTTGEFCFKVIPELRDTNSIEFRMIPAMGTDFYFKRETPESFNQRTVFFFPIV